MLIVRQISMQIFSGQEKIEEEIPKDVLRLISDGQNVIVLGNGGDVETRWEVVQR